jgi:hypothetical protein
VTANNVTVPAAALIASLFATVAFAQTAAPGTTGAAQSAAAPATPAAAAPAAYKKHTHTVSSHHKVKLFKLDSSKVGSKDTLK